MCARQIVPLRVLVADQHRIVRAGIRVLLMEMSSWQSFDVDEAETTEHALAMLACHPYHVVLVDYSLPGRGGVKVTNLISTRWPSVRVLALCDSDDSKIADQMTRAGAMGCILRNVGAEMLVFAIRTVLSGKRFFSNEIAQRLLDRSSDAVWDPLVRLTLREKEVFKAILDGCSAREIASRMGIAKRTVDKHRQHIHYKLGTKTPLELIQVGIRFGLLIIG